MEKARVYLIPVVPSIQALSHSDIC